MHQDDETRLSQARRWFFTGEGPHRKNHRVESRYPLVGNHGEVIVWKAPGTNINSLVYVIFGRYLLVFGDLGDAVYAWSENVTVPFLAGCNIDYFEEKCQASPYGRRFQVWNDERCCDRVQEYLVEVVREHISENFGEAEQDEARPAIEAIQAKGVTLTVDQAIDILIKERADEAIAKPSGDKEIERLKELADEAKRATSSQHEWVEFLHGDEGTELFGNDAWELSDWGMEVDNLCYAHLAGLRMIQEIDNAEVEARQCAATELRKAMAFAVGKPNDASTRGKLLKLLRECVDALVASGIIKDSEKPEFDLATSVVNPQRIYLLPLNEASKKLCSQVGPINLFEDVDGVSQTEG